MVVNKCSDKLSCSKSSSIHCLFSDVHSSPAVHHYLLISYKTASYVATISIGLAAIRVVVHHLRSALVQVVLILQQQKMNRPASDRLPCEVRHNRPPLCKDALGI